MHLGGRPAETHNNWPAHKISEENVVHGRGGAEEGSERHTHTHTPHTDTHAAPSTTHTDKHTYGYGRPHLGLAASSTGHKGLAAPVTSR